MGCSEGATAVDPRESPVPAVASSSTLCDLPAAPHLRDRPDGLSEVEAITLVAALAAVPDPRQARGRRYSLQAVVMLALTGVMAGARSPTALAQWAREGQHKVALCGPLPSLWTFRRVLCADTAAGPRAAERVVLACDGK